MPAITVVDLNNAKLDVDHIADIAISTSATATDRLGQLKPTIKGAMDSISAKLTEVETVKTTAINTAIPAIVALVETAKDTAINTGIPAAVALVDEAVALTAAGSATAAKVDAEAARDLSQTYAAAGATAAKYADTIALGRTGAVDGVTFGVKAGGADGLARPTLFRRDSSTTQTEIIAQFPAGEFDEVFERKSYTRSGYVWALVDSGNRIGLAMRKDGKFDIGTTQDVGGKVKQLLVDTVGVGSITAAFKDYPVRGGAVWGVMDASKRLAVWIDKTGSLRTPQGSVSAMFGAGAGYQTQINANGVRIDNLDFVLNCSTDIVGLGDSLTEGAGTSNAFLYSWCGQLSTIYAGLGTPRSVMNLGIGGQVSAQIVARGGAGYIFVTLSGNSVPASGAVAISSLSVNLLTTPATTVARTLKGWIAGVYGTLSKDTSNAYSFTRDVAGLAVPVTAEVVFTLDASTFNRRTMVIWTGTNDAGEYVNTRAYIAQAIAAMRPYVKRFVVMGLTGSSGDVTGSAGEIALTAHNRELKMAYPGNYLDLRSVLIRAYNPDNAQDVIDVANGIVPSSLRSDSIHLNQAGYLIVAQAVKAFLDSKGW